MSYERDYLLLKIYYFNGLLILNIFVCPICLQEMLFFYVIEAKKKLKSLDVLVGTKL